MSAKTHPNTLKKFATELDATIYMNGGFRGSTHGEGSAGYGWLHYAVECALECTGLKLVKVETRKPRKRP